MLQRIVLALLLGLFATQAQALDLWRPKGAPAFLDENGNPLAGKLCFYDAGTTNQRTVYKDSAGGTAWTQPITLDSAGRLSDPIFVPTGAFKEVLRSADATDCATGTVIYTADSIPGAFDTSVFDIDYALPEQPVISKASDYTVTTDDLGSVFNVNATGGNVTLTLPSAATAGNGAVISVRKVDSSANTAILSTVSSQTIDGASTKTLTLQYQHVTVVSDGANWNTIAGIAPTTVTFAQLAGAVYDTDGTLAANSDTKFPTQKAVKTYVDTISASGVKWKDPVRVATTANGTFATAFDNASSVDGVTIATNDRILIKNQTSASENGIYVVAASGAPTRATDADAGAEILGATVFVQEGSTNADTQWTNTNSTAPTLGSDNVTFSLIAAGTTYTAGAGLDLSGSAFSVENLGIVEGMIAAGAVTSTKIGSDAIGTGNIASGAVGTTDIADDAVTYAKMQNVSATDRFLGRDSSGAGNTEEISPAAAFQMICGSDPNADRIAFWDDSAGGCAWLTPSTSHFSISSTTMSLATGVTLALRTVGEIITTSASSCPTGSLEANGAAVSRSTYSALFAAISDDYGAGDGSTTFNLPDYRGQFLRGWDHGAGVDTAAGSRTNRGDGTTGDNVGTKQGDAFASHTHDNNSDANNGSINVQSGSGASVADNGGTRNTLSAGTGTETRPKNINVLYCVYAGA